MVLNRIRCWMLCLEIIVVDGFVVIFIVNVWPRYTRLQCRVYVLTVPVSCGSTHAFYEYIRTKDCKALCLRLIV